MTGRHLLVTGAAGFIGSHVCEALLRAGDRVTGVDSFDDFYDPALKRQNADLLAAYPEFALSTFDIRDGDQLAAAMQGVDFVLHFAARAGVRASLRDPVTYADVNVRGSAMVLEAASAAGVSGAVLASSSSVYGARSEAPFHEDDPCDRPISPYAATKRAMELLARAHAETTGMPVTCLRFFTAYGPRQRPEMAVSAFLAAVAEGRPVEVFGDGSARRDFTYIDDISDGVLKALDHLDGFRIYNLGDQRTWTVRELIEQVGLALGREPEIQWGPPSPGDVPLTCAAIDRARDELGWEPRVGFEEGLRRTAEWFMARRGA